ncbi:MAG: hypothetical protein NWE96_10705 [Candidatus Bathyarchaeota archaeon]|nr:hypothetical protein [Candidatus Bathyarchaeota archaeon]
MIAKLFLQGIILTGVLSEVAFYLDGAQTSFMMYMPPIGFALLLVVTYLIQPIAVGALNIFLINILYGTKGWQVEFWLNGIFLLLAFTTINLVFQTTLGWSLLVAAVVDVALLAIPFGAIARFSNGGWKKPIN